MRVLVVKTSSLGDILHTLPALTDAAKIYPDISFDWVVEEPFREIPAWHPKVKRVIPVALRRWRKQPLVEQFSSLKSGEIREFLKTLRQEKYDYIIDAQGLLKSIMLILASRGKHKVGLSWHSAREPLASLFYQKRVKVLWEQHAVVRARALFAGALNYTLPTPMPDYGVNLKTPGATSGATPGATLGATSGTTPAALSSSADQYQTSTAPYFIFLHGTTWDTKHWPEYYWIELGKLISVEMPQQRICLLWGSDAERSRAERIAAVVPNAYVVEKKLSLKEVSQVIANATGIVSVDTGLGHLAAALSVPTVSLYGPTDPKLCGALGENQIHLTSSFACAPCRKRTCQLKEDARLDKNIDPPCFSHLPPQKVWEQLQGLILK